jgi:hypothetical protein
MDKFLYAYVTRDYGCRFFTGCPKPTGPNSIPLKITHGPPIGSPGDFPESVFGEKYTVYFILDTERWLVKIGRTQSLHRRLKHYTNAIEVLGVLKRQGKAAEKGLHIRFEEDFVEDSWFSPSEALMRFISQEC